MLDECITQKCARIVAEYIKLNHEVSEAHFLCDYLGDQGALDCDWTELLKPPEEWIVISSDCGRSGPRIHAKGPPLPIILPQKKITGFFLGGKTLTQGTGELKTRAIISKAKEILRHAESASPGQRFKIRMSGSSSGIVVVKWD
jgi:hypothetical protein